MYQTNKIKTNNSQFKYFFTNSNQKLTYQEFINLLKSKDKEFLKIFRETLNNATDELSAYFWECIPVSNKTIDKEFEFVATKNEELEKITQNYSAFQGYINQALNNYVTSFLSLHKNATLIIPIPKNNANGEVNYKNLKEFTANSSLEQWEEFWQKVGEEMEESLFRANGATRWLSTSGLNVYYLHVRINNSPKHYVYEEYLRETEAKQEILGKKFAN